MNDKELLNQSQKVLEGIINSCVHPETAHRAVFIELKPIRDLLKKIKSNLDNSNQEIEDEMELCDMCNEPAWDGHICHNCGLKKL